MNRYVCIHGHFYQPPRENPWLEHVELQDSAYPYHDWNERIAEECYGPNTASRILDHEKRIVDIINNFGKISFNFGPTLLSWMESQKPDLYGKIIEADKNSREIFSGHGAAIAQPYNHMIMPLASDRDKRTQVLWGIMDFEYRFGRKPEGMWLPETAVDLETLGIMAECGISYTILSPHQAKRVRKVGEKKWKDVSREKVDPKLPYLCRLPSKRSIVIFFSDGPISRDIAFGGLLKSGENFANRLLSAFTGNGKRPQLVNIATDGETFGHHQRHGDMALAYCLYHLETNGLAQITIFGEYLEKFPPIHEVDIFEDTSWSCGHGIERWRNDCGCCSGNHPGWNQGWRTPLRNALDWLRDTTIPLYVGKMSPLVRNPWIARDNYIDVILDRSKENIEQFLADHATRDLSTKEKVEILKLLEMQRHLMLMYTSCGWFFDDISGVETVKVLEYAERSIQLASEVAGVDLGPSFLEILKGAKSNVTDYGDGGKIMEHFVKPAVIDLTRVGAHYAVSSLFEKYPDLTKIFCYTNKNDSYLLEEAGKLRLAMGKSKLFSEITWEEIDISFAVIHLGDHNLFGGAREFGTYEDFSIMQKEIKEAFRKSDVPSLLRMVEKHFGLEHYSLWHLFKDEQQKVLDQILDSTLKDIEVSFRQAYEFRYPIMQAMREIHIPIPSTLTTTIKFIINLDLQRVLEKDTPDLDRLERLIGEAKKWSVTADGTTLSYIASRRVNLLMESLLENPDDIPLLSTLDRILKLLNALELDLDLWKSQNIYFPVGKNFYYQMKERKKGGDQAAVRWLKLFDSLGRSLHVKII